MKLQELFPAIELAQQGETEICDLCDDSRFAKEGVLFFCLCGASCDGHTFALDAYARGARAFVAQRPLSLPNDCVTVLVSDSRKAYARACAKWFGTSRVRPYRFIGVTGTKGKTTVCAYLASILRTAGKSCAVIGTNGIEYNGICTPTSNTTPDPYTLHRALSHLAKQGTEYILLEVSSQAYLQHRVFGLHFDLAIFTNLSCDHIGAGEHRDFDDYKSCKLALFSHCDHAILNYDDDYFLDFARACHCPYTTFGIHRNAQFTATNCENVKSTDSLGTQFCFCEGEKEICRITLSQAGEHNIGNALCAMAAARRFGFDPSLFSRALNLSIAGRYDYYPLQNGAVAVIDYAHNGTALRCVLQSLRPFCSGRLYCLFGSVGGRTEIRRHALGLAADTYADFSFLTADNPDFEEVEAICLDIASGFSSQNYKIIPDRAQAIRYALSLLKEGDLLVLCGKGQERTQRVRGRDLPFCEAELLLPFLKKERKITKRLPKT